MKELRIVVSFPSCMIFNKSLSTDEVPNDWKIVHVTPVFKKGTRSLAENYRPISLTYIVCKIFEPFICRAIVNYLSEHRLMNASQHGFVSECSCLTNLLEYLDTLTSLLNKGHNIRPPPQLDSPTMPDQSGSDRHGWARTGLAGHGLAFKFGRAWSGLVGHIAGSRLKWLRRTLRINFKSTKECK